MAHNLTLSIVTSIPFSNLNRDDTGTPKRINQGGVLRALHSSQSIKRGIRKRYEEASMDTSVRSGELAEAIVERVLDLNSDVDEKAALKNAKQIVGKLTKSESSETKGAEGGNDTAAKAESARSTWMSSEEINTAAQTVLNILTSDKKMAKTEVNEFIDGHRTGALAIAAFGRMFANSPQNTTEAALSVSPAVTTHATSIDTDYFSTVDDRHEAQHRTGATFLGVSQYTNGVFYRTVSIDKKQLRESWSAFDSDGAKDNVRELVRAVIYGQPRGKEHSTAPYVLPALVLAEEQRYRTAYDFQTPVTPVAPGGYLEATIISLAQQYSAARDFDASNFGPTEALAGTFPDLDGKFGNLKRGQLDALINAVVEWVFND